MSEYNKTIALRWFKAFNNKDLELLLGLYRDDAQHVSPRLRERLPHTRGIIKGKPALAEWWGDAFTRLPSVRRVPRIILADRKSVLMESIRKVQGEPDSNAVEALDIVDQHIQESRVYLG